MPRPSYSIEHITCYDLEDPGERQKARSRVESYKVNTLVCLSPLEKELVETLSPYLGEPLAGPEEFFFTPRNPLIRGRSNQIMAYRLNTEKGRGLKK